MKLEGIAGSERRPFAQTGPDGEPRGKHRARLRAYGTLFILDILSILTAFMVANAIRSGTPFARSGLDIVVVLMPLYLAVAANAGVYGIAFFRRWDHNARNSVAAFCAATAAVLLVSFYLGASNTISRSVFTFGGIVSAVTLVMHRFVLHLAMKRALGGTALNEVVICDDVTPPPDQQGFVVSAAVYGITPDIRDPRALDRIGRLLKTADRVVIACPESRRGAWAMVLKGANIQGEILTPELDTLGTLGASSFSGSSTLVVSIRSLDTRSRAAKRALDLSLALPALFFLAPLLAIVAIAIRFDSGGPVFFVQSRLGRGNRLFSMYKFRSMRIEASDRNGDRSTERGDSRVTRFGRIIRATSVDELPQLFNVLKGDMSLVGPRPHALGSLAGDKLFWEVDQRYWHRHAVKPGITGLAQVRGLRGATHFQSDLADRLQHDLDYLNKWTLWRDVRILVATVKVVLHKNAY